MKTLLKFINAILLKFNCFIIQDHYYNPLINPKKHLTKSLRDDRNLPGIDLNIEGQLELLSQFHYNDELRNFPIKQVKEHEFYYDNGSFMSGDAEYLYNMIRHFKPRKVVEIGSGNSTLIAREAIRMNYPSCLHICIEPYEQPWLENSGINVIRKKVEDVRPSIFSSLQKNDILFIDSSHIIRPQGDVLFEYLELLPMLAPGVIVHVHDIFTPKDYLDEWVYGHKFWDEQYLLEAFLTFNSKFKVLGALNYLSHNYHRELADKCPILAKQTGREPGSFWMVKL